MRIMLDTNVLISAIVLNGKKGQGNGALTC